MANSADPDQTASLTRVCTVCSRFLVPLIRIFTLNMEIHILSKSANQPFGFYHFPSMLLSISQFSLQPQIVKYVSKPYHLKVKHYFLLCIQEAKMNAGTPIFKINKNLH